MYLSTTVVTISVLLSAPWASASILFFHSRSMASSSLHSTTQDVYFFDPTTNATLVEPVVGPLAAPNSAHPHHHPAIHRDANDNTSLVAAGRATTEKPPSGWFANFRRPCSCVDLQCGCCAGVDFRRLNFRRQYCTNFTYDPQAFAIQMDVLMDDNSVYQNQVSARNPDPVCVPVPYLPIGADLCVKMFNIFTPGRNLHMCMDWQARIAKAPVLVLHFDCMRFGQDGVALVKPDQNGGLEEFGGTGGAAAGSSGGGGASVDSENGGAAVDQTDVDIFDGVSESSRNKMTT